MPAEYYVDYRWFLERQEELLDDLAGNDYSVFVGLAARHKVDRPDTTSTALTRSGGRR